MRDALIQRYLEDEIENNIDSKLVEIQLGYLDYYFQLLPRFEVSSLSEAKDIDKLSLSKTTEFFSQNNYLQKFNADYKNSQDSFILNNAYREEDPECPENSVMLDAIRLVTKIFKRTEPWNYKKRAKIEQDFAVISKDGSNSKAEGMKAVALLRNLHIVPADQEQLSIFSDDILATLPKLIRMQKMSELSNEDSAKERIKAEIRETVSFSFLPDLLKAEYLVLQLSLAHKISDIDTIKAVIKKAVPLYEALKNDSEIDMQFELGVIIASDIQNYDMSEYKTNSEQIFSELNNVLNSDNLRWIADQKEEYEFNLYMRMGVQNNLAEQATRLTSLLDRFPNEGVSSKQTQAKYQIMTNLTGIDFYKNNPSDHLTPLNRLISDKKTKLKSADFEKGNNNYQILSYLEDKVTLEEAIEGFEFMYPILKETAPKIDKINFRDLPHPIVLINFAILQAKVGHAESAKVLFDKAEQHLDNDNFYYYYVSYNVAVLNLSLSDDDITNEFEKKIQRLAIPNLLKNNETEGILHRRTNKLTRIIHEQSTATFASVEKEFIKAMKNIDDIPLNHDLYLFTDWQYWF